MFKGITATHTYWLWSEDGSLALTERSGEDLLQSKVSLHLAVPNSSDILFFQDAALGKP